MQTLAQAGSLSWFSFLGKGFLLFLPSFSPSPSSFFHRRKKHLWNDKNGNTRSSSSFTSRSLSLVPPSSEMVTEAPISPVSSLLPRSMKSLQGDWRESTRTGTESVLGPAVGPTAKQLPLAHLLPFLLGY